MKRNINVDLNHDELFANSKPLLAFSKSNDYQSWKEQIREKYIELLGLKEIENNALTILFNVKYNVRYGR